MDEKIVALLENELSCFSPLPVLLVIPYIGGLVSLFISGRRVRGLLTMIYSILYSCAFIGLIYGYITVKGIALFAAIIVLLEVVGWVKFHHFLAKKCVITLIFFSLVIVGLLVAIPLIKQQEVLLFIKTLTTIEWSCIIFFACLGIWVMPHILNILVFMLECTNTNSHSSSNRSLWEDCTDEHNSVDITSMADSSDSSDY